MTPYSETGPVIFPAGAATQTSAEEAAKGKWDAVIVGGGMAGSIVANQLSQAGYKVVILEAGPGKDLDLAEYESYLSRFYGAVIKDNQSPYPRNPNARMPRSTDARPVDPSGGQASSGCAERLRRGQGRDKEATFGASQTRREMIRRQSGLEPRARQHRGCWRSRSPPTRDVLGQGDAARWARFVHSEPRARLRGRDAPLWLPAHS